MIGIFLCRRALPALGVVALLAAVDPAAAQQFVTDDAAIVDRRACQVEAWVGESEAWVQPACQFVPRLELSAGLGRVRDGRDRSTVHLLEGKFLFREPGDGRIGYGMVAGLVLHRAARSFGEGPSEAFAYAVSSFPVANENATFHANLGWHSELEEHDHDERGHGSDGHLHDRGAHHALTWAVRADVVLPMPGDRLTGIGEVYGENGGRPGYQLGLRATVIPARLLFDVSWGGHAASDERGTGWTLGVSWTPPPLY